MKSAKIIGTGSALPEKILTNADLSKTVETSDEWIRSRTGIEERRVTDEKTSSSDLALTAVKKALSAAGTAAEELDLIIVGTSTPDTLFPSVGCIIQGKIGAKNAAAFDVSAACSGFNYALATAHAFFSSGKYKKALVVGTDTLAKYLDWTDRGTCVLFGDGAGAVVLESCEKGRGILADYLSADGIGAGHLVMPGGGSRNPRPKNEKERCISMDGKEVFKFAVKALETSLLKAVEEAGLSINDISLLIPHQANIRIIDHTSKKLSIPKERIFVNLQKYGNTSAASIPIALDEARRSGRIKKDDIIAIVGFGAGLTTGANIIRWEI
ncbi:MAG: ketoacyl-ACP synthase III [Candidatus Saganbacteria bacterium]|nr:ketoacyl-ACP synthase III [Candidatus Saganbacteria bacterium]